MSAFLRANPVIVAGLVFVAIAALVLAIIGLMMARGGMSLKPIWWFAGLLLLVGGPQLAWHVIRGLRSGQSDARVAAALEPANWETAFGPDVDPGLVSDPRAAFGDVFAKAETVRFAPLPGGETMLLAKFRSPGDAERAWVGYLRAAGLAGIAKGDSERGASATRPAGDRVYAAPMGTVLGVWSGPDDAAIRRRMAAGGFTPHRRAPLDGAAVAATTRAPDGYPAPARAAVPWPLAAAGLAVWLLVVAAWFFKGASWAGSSAPVADAKPAAADELRERLLAINALDVPFRIEPGDRPDQLVATWRYADAKWIGLAGASGTRKVHRVVMSLDEGDRTVRATDWAASHDWSAGADGASVEWKQSMGIVFFEQRSATTIGLRLDERGRPVEGLAHRWRFDLNELKAPLVAAVTGAGWTWRPVVWQGPGWLKWLTE